MTAAAQRWDAMRAMLRARADAPTSAPRTGDRPASFAQEALWIHHRLSPNNTAYHLAVACRLEGELDIVALAHALAALIARHEILRTTLHAEERGVVQRVHPPSAVALSAETIDEDFAAWAIAKAAMPFSLAIEPPFRACLARRADGDHCLLLAQHHSIFDGWSFEVFMRELCALYDAARRGAPSPLAALTLQHGDYAAWQRRHIGGERHAQLVAYWRTQLATELPVLRLPVDRPGASDARGATATATLRAAQRDALKRLAADTGTTLYVVLLAAFKVLLHRLTGDDDIVVGGAFSTRTHAELADQLGMYINTLPLRTTLGGRPTFRALVARVAETVNGASAHRELPLEQIAKTAGRAHATTPLFHATFTLQNVPRSNWQWPELRATAWAVPMRHAKYALGVVVTERGDDAEVLAEYDADQFDAATIERLLAQLAKLLDEVVRDPDRPIDTVPILDEAARMHAMAAWNDTAARYPRDEPIHRVFETHAQRTPSAIALRSDHGELTYAELDRRANQLAHRLARMTLGLAPRIAVLLPRSPERIIAQLAILKAGGAYVPLDADAPVHALRERATAATAIATDAAGATLAASLARPIARIDDATLADEPAHAPALDVDASALAYVMFTSGSTGAPRGVCVRHRGVVRLVCGQRYARFAADDIFLQLAPTTFDASTLEIWGALLNGATLAIAPPQPLSIAELRAAIERHGVSMLVLTTGLFERFADHGGGAPCMRMLLVGGDVMSAAHADRFLRANPACRLVNAYGPTENATITTTQEVVIGAHRAAIPIGHPIANTRVYVLDRHRAPVPIGVVGEAYAAGDGVARGYLDDPAETHARFVEDPLAPGHAMYATGDLVRRRADGVLEFVGRVDDQIKVRGVRIEPRAIEHALLAHARVRQTAVVAEAAGAIGKRLVAFVVADRAEDDLAATLRAFLRARLPAYMVPSEVTLVDAIPLTANGKPDRKALRARPPRAHAPAVRPRDHVEDVLEHIFARLVQRERVAIHDSFFDIGGDSLAAVALVAAIERELGQALPLITVFAQPTIAELAEVLRDREAALAIPSLGARVVEIKPGNLRRPLFLVVSGAGRREEATIYARLVTRVRDDAAILGLLAPHEGATLTEIARHYLDDIRRVQPRGPYRIGGQCIGGVAAFEIAQQLHARGEEVELLLLLDSWLPTTGGLLYHRLIGRPRSQLRAGLAFLASLRNRPRSAEPWYRELLRRARVPAKSLAHMRACGAYRAQPYPGEVLLLASDDSLRRGIAESWRAVATGGLTVRPLPGDHESYFKHHAATTAACLRVYLEAYAQRKAAT